MYGIGDHGVLTAHDARKSHSLLSVTYCQHIMVELPLLTVKSREGVTVLGALYDDLSTGDGRQIEGMHRLTVLKHHEICDIHDIADGAYAAGAESLLHPFG